jgi:hypothetical protein
MFDTMKMEVRRREVQNPVVSWYLQRAALFYVLRKVIGTVLRYRDVVLNFGAEALIRQCTHDETVRAICIKTIS